ncbi:MAG: TonB-dependent receptor [Alloprevotella sp.]|nr:TonB-dependent receptor [Alloprevotella sp.]
MKRILFLSGLLMLSAHAFAQSNAKPDSAKTQELQEATVVATRAGKTTPMAYTNLSRRELQALNVGVDVPYLLLQTPNITAASDAGTGIGYTYLRVRGTDPTRINITTNGIPLNDSESNSVYWVNMGDFTSNVGSIQVQRGVGTSTNGSGAFGASVNLQTEAIPSESAFRFDLTGGAYGTHKETFSFTTGLLRDHWGVSGRLSNIGSNGFIDRAKANLNSYFLQAGYFGDNTVVKFITFNGMERTYHAWDYATREQLNTYGRRYNPSGKYTDAAGNTAYYKDQIDDYHQQHYQLHWTQHLPQNLTWNMALHYTHGKGYYETYKTNRKLYQFNLESALGARSDLVRRKYSGADFYGTTFSLNYTGQKLKTIFGGGYNHYVGDHWGQVRWVREFSGSIDPNKEYYRNRAHKQDFNIYGRADYELLRGLNLYADLQYRFVNYKMYGPSDEFKGPGEQISFDFRNKFHFFNPKAGLFYQISRNHVAYLSYAMAHKEPTRNDYEAALWSPEPRSERLNDFELGYRYESKTFSAGLNLYYMLYKDQFVLTGERDDQGEMIAANVGDSYRRGIEVTAAWQPVRWFRWDANVSWSHNRAKDMYAVLDDVAEPFLLGNTPLPFSPNVVFNNTLAFNYRGFKAALRSQYVSRQFMTTTGLESFEEDGKDVSLLLNSYFTSDLDLSYSFTGLNFCKDVTLGMTVYNIFNKHYEANGSAYTALKSNGRGGVMGYQDADWNSYAVFSAQAPAHIMAHFSISF